MAFCKEYNAQTAKMAGDVVPVEITVYEVRGGSLGGWVGGGMGGWVRARGLFVLWVPGRLLSFVETLWKTKETCADI